MPSSTPVKFEHSEAGMTRFPPNVEQITVRRDHTVTWIIMRRNDLELRFRLNADDCRHLANLLKSPTDE